MLCAAQMLVARLGALTTVPAVCSHLIDRPSVIASDNQLPLKSNLVASLVLLVKSSDLRNMPRYLPDAAIHW